MTSYGVLMTAYSGKNLPGVPKIKNYSLVREYLGYRVEVIETRGGAIWKHNTQDGRLFEFFIPDKEWVDLDFFVSLFERYLMNLINYLDSTWDREIRRYSSRDVKLIPKPVEPVQDPVSPYNATVKYVHVEVKDKGDYLIAIWTRTGLLEYYVLDPITKRRLYGSHNRWSKIPYILYSAYHTQNFREPVRKLMNYFRRVL